MKNPITRNLVAPCGMNCGICKGYLREKNPCPGCKYIRENKPVTRVKCRMRTCTKRRGRYCCNCPDFPCARLLQLDKRYRTKYGMSEIENLEFIKENGIRKFVAAERERWISEKGILCVHDKRYYK
jgi:hypothetical protein